MHLPQLFLIIEVRFVEDEKNWNPISLSTCKKTVDESRARFWMRNSGHKRGHIDICSYDVALLRQIGGFSDNVIPSVLDILNQCSLSVRTRRNSHYIAYCNRICTPDTLEAKGSLYLAVK